MLKKKLAICYIILLLLIPSVLAIPVFATDSSPTIWDKNWSYNQEIILPISTISNPAKFQPIDIKIFFERPCWAKNQNEHSVRTVCWHRNSWHELESQIYDLEFKDSEYILSCGLVFLIPDFADGSERYFIYYDDNEKVTPNYIDHVNVTDEYFYYEPVSGLSVEGDYYEVSQNDNIIYGVGQKGRIINRKLSQVVIKLQNNVKKFDITKSEIFALFCFSYYTGVNEEDEISSDQVLVSKKINVDGNLMVEFGIISESKDGSIRTTNVYKYYYCPNDDKKISVHVKHENLKNTEVKGIINIDGRYGALISYNTKIGRNHFGEIMPYLHTIDENNKLREYLIVTNPENKEREWLVSYEDDCDIGKDSWISYDQGETKTSHAILFSSNENIVKQGKNERDGLQIKVTENEYLDVIGAEVDYAAINFGRNSYEKGGKHDLLIPNNLVVEYNAEFFSSNKDSYKSVKEEEKYFKPLAKYRFREDDGSFEGDQNINTLTVYAYYTGRLSTPLPLFNITGEWLPIVYMELYKDDILLSTKYANNPLFAAPRVKFPKLAKGEYIVKVYRKIGKNIINFIGVKKVIVEEDTNVKIFCSWQKDIKISVFDQFNNKFENVDLILYKKDTIVTKNTTIKDKDTIFCYPFNLFGNYNLKAFYKDFLIYDKDLTNVKKQIEIKIDLYNLEIQAKDELGFSPGVNIRPYLTSSQMYSYSEIPPKSLGSGKFIFKNIPKAEYELYISYGSFSDKLNIEIKDKDEFANIKFSARYDLSTELYDSYGSKITDKKQEIDIIRNGKIIYNSVKPDKSISLPPGDYKLKVYSENKLVASKNINLINNKKVIIVTTLKSIIPALNIGLALIFILEILVLLIIKKISLNTFLKLIAMSLILLSIFQPWWYLNSTNTQPIAERNTELYINTQTMIENTVYDGQSYREIATIPEEFTNFLGVLLFVVCSGFILIGLSFIPNILQKRRHSLILIFSSALFLVIIGAAFCYGMSKITEISIGDIGGQDILDITLPNGDVLYMQSNWGIGLGFHLCIIAALLALLAGVIDFFKKKEIVKKLTSN